MADTQDVKAQLSAFRLRPKKAQSPASSPMSPSFSFPSITPSHSNSSMKSTNSTSSTSSTRVSSASSVASSPELPLPPKSRPHSHHKRKSSVSTRRESSEIMGVPCPEESEEDSRDEIRKRALLALEGRSVVAGFAKVEIPDWISPTSDNKGFEKETVKVPPLGISSLLGKRDSFGRNLVNSSTSKAELHTLVEEDEEEDENVSKTSCIPSTRVIEPSPNKPRPPSLSLRTLSLVGDLPTPNSTPSPRGSTRIRQLTLQASPSIYNSPSPLHRPSSSLSPEPITPLSAAVSSPSLAARRQSQLASKRSPTGSDVLSELSNGPLTPSRTPQSSVSSATSGDRPMSPTELFAHHAYTIQNHASLLERISTLEDALAAEKQKSSSADELIALVADLKAERDQLHGNVAEALRRHTELERAGEVCKKRLEMARQEAWLHKDRAELLQVELDKISAEKSALESQKAGWAKERSSFIKENQIRNSELKTLQTLNERLERELRDAQNSTRRFMSGVDSRSSSATTFVDESDTSFDSFRISAPKLKDANPDLASVAEVDEINHEDEEYGNEELASYEAEPTECMNYDDQYIDEDDDLTDDGKHNDDSSSTPSVRADQDTIQHKEVPTHAKKASLVTSWKFPRGPASVTAKKQSSNDPFNLDLDADEDSPQSTPLSTPPEMLGTPMHPKTQAKKISPALAETFAMNFQEDESFSFGVAAEPASGASPNTAPAVESPKLSPRPFGLSGRDQSNMLASTATPAAIPTKHLPHIHGDLVPPPKAYSKQIGTLVAPLVHKPSPPKVQAPITPTKPAISLRPTAQPITHIFTPPPRVTEVSRRSPVVPATTVSDLDEEFSFFNSPPHGHAQSSAAPSNKNNVEFPTTSASPFRMRLSLGSFASFMPWSPSRSQQPAPAPSLAAQVEAVQGKRAAVNPDVMRERLRARLVQEGKIGGTNKVAQAPVSRSSTPTPTPTPSTRVSGADHICLPGCSRCRGTGFQC